MKYIAQAILGLLFMLVVAAGLRHVFGTVRDAITGQGIRGLVLWKNDWTDALAEGAARHKPVLVEFASESSANCQELAKKGWSRMDIASATSDYVPVMVDIGAHPELARQYAVATVPSLLVIDAQSQSVIRDGRDSAFTPDELLVWLKPDAPPKWNALTPANGFDSQSGLIDNQKSRFTP